MTEIFKHIADFLQNDATLGNISAFLFMLCTVVGSWFNKVLKNKNAILQAKILKQEDNIKNMMDKMSKGMLALSNMFEVAFSNSKIDVKTKLYLQEQHNNLFKAMEGLAEKVEKVEVEVKPKVVEVKALEEEKSVLDKIKEDL